MAMVELLGEKLQKPFEGEIDTATAFEGKKAVALYFSAHWCPPCRGFTPKLAEFYTKDLSGKGLEVVFLSSDQDQAQFDEYLGEMPWLAVPYSNREKKEALSKKFKVQGIPTIIIVDPADGSVINKDGRSCVMKDPTGDKLPWKPPTFAEAMASASFLKGTDAVDKSAIEGKTLGLYFSAHWCPPCRMFTPQLAKWYAGVKADVGDKFEIIFCTRDRDEESFKSYYAEQTAAGGDWLALTYETKGALDDLFEVRGIPTFIIVGPDGKVVNQNGRSIVPEGTAAGFPWAPPAIADLSNPDGINETPAICLMLESCDPETQKKYIDAVTPIAEEYAKQDEPELIFFAAKEPGGVAGQIRGMCGIGSADVVASSDQSPDSAPKIVRTISDDTPTVILMDIPDDGGYYVGRMAKEFDGSGVKAMIEGWKAKTLERKQLS